MANQPRPWFRLRSTIGQPPAPTSRPEAQTAPPPPVVPLVRPGFGRALTFRPNVAPPPPPPPGKTEPSPLPTQPPQASSSSSSSSSSSPLPSPSPPHAPSPTATSTSPPQPPAALEPKAAASPPRAADTPTPPTTTVTPPTPHATTTSPPSPHVRFSTTTTSQTVPTTPDQRAPPKLQPASPPHDAAVPPASVATPLQFVRRSPNHVTTSTPTPTPPQGSPTMMKMKQPAGILPPPPPPATSIKTPSPTHSTTPKAPVPPPSPLTLPPPQLQPGSHYNIPDVPQQKTVLEDSSSRTTGNNNYHPRSRAAGHSKPSNSADDKDRIRKRTGGLSAHKQATEAKPNDHFRVKKVEMKGKDKEEMVWSSADSEDTGIRIITIAGENKGAVMEVGRYSSPTTWTSGSDNVQKNGKGRGISLKKSGRKESSGSVDDNDHGREGSSKKDGNKKSDKAARAEKASRAFVNSNVQGVNNSIVNDCTFSHEDPGVHVALTRLVAGHGSYFKHHQHIGHDDDSRQK